MKVLICLIVLIPFVSLSPVSQPRVYFPEEEDPNFKRYIYVESENGELQLVDLLESAEPAVELKVVTSDVFYDLYTQSNKATPYVITNGNVALLGNSHFNPAKYSLFIIHGWNNDHESAVNTLIRDAAFQHHDINVFVVDWSSYSHKNYLSAKNAVKAVGEIVGNFINQIQSTYKLGGTSFILVGHSLGAHVAGNTGAMVKSKVDHIVGLDPAGPLFTIKNTDNRLDTTDGNFVEVIHTNSALLGFGSAIGHVDYFPNGGKRQAGCGIDMAGTCSHGRSYRFFAESLTRGAVFKARLCSDYDNYENNKCSANRQSAMGQLELDTGARGDYFLNTNAESPYGKS